MLSISAFALLAAAQPASEKPPVQALPAISVSAAAQGPDAVRPRVIIQDARPLAPLASWFSRDDYPAATLRLRQQGSVSFSLQIGADGRVTGCFVRRSSGSIALDEATCRILQGRGRFSPAVNAVGNPIQTRYDGAVAWHLAGPVTEVVPPPGPRIVVRELPPSAPRITTVRGATPAAASAAASPNRPLQSLISMADYPAAALASRQEGRTSFRLTVGADGRVTGCVILVSSGSAALDDATCRIVRSRGRFSPARDPSGRPIEDQYFGELAWRIVR